MSLLGNAAMVLFFDLDVEDATEHDHWHTHEHFAERLGIPGFRRASRWAAAGPGPRYFVMYETAEVETLTSDAYRARLDHPSPWTRTLMPHYRNMVRGLTRVVASSGAGIGGAALVVRFAAQPGREAALDAWLSGLVPQLALHPGLAGAHLLRSAAAAEMTAEQAMRGRDGGVDGVLVVTGYDLATVREVSGNALGEAALAAHGAAPGRLAHTFRLAATATGGEAVALPASR
ncbi:MAG: hypothetical protein JNM90_02480 [Burkholderiales bacterium]|nr:hypothetical protein [Burkholderiales bacterium]